MEGSQIDLYEFLTEAELQHYYNAIKNELKITNATQFKYASYEDLKSISMSRPEIRRLRKYYEKHFPHGYLSKIKRFLHNAPAAAAAASTIIVKRDDCSSNTNLSSAASSTGFGLNASTALNKTTTDSPNKVPNNKHIIPPDAISVNKQLGTGEFGIVQQGVWTNGNERIQVAIKCLCRERMQSNPMEFLKEAAIMHSIEHENIVRLYGVVLATDSLMLVTELAHLRSLLECLKDPGLRVSFLTVSTLCEFALQICNGMSYLENKRLIHRDLAARNILVFSKNKVKISDFGLSRALGVGKDYYKTNFNVNLKLPIAWCAPESINYLRFTNASDVWAFGVCLWEMFSYGFQPWAALTGLQILEAIDAPNYQRLEQPECCPREYYTLMMKCWQDDASKRPKFSEIYELLPELKPEQLKAVCKCLEAKSKDHLLYRQNDIITVLDRNTGTPYWKGVLNNGKTGFFNPSNTVAYLEGLPTLNRETFSRNTLDRSTRRKLCTEMISKPQNDLKHTGHVGIDGATFGDIAFLGSSQNYNHVPRQIVTPYKPSEDIEQTPLLLPPTPTSPDSLQTASGYFADDNDGHHPCNSTLNPSFVPSAENTPKNFSDMNGHQTNAFEFPSNCSKTNPFTTNEISRSNDVTVKTAAGAVNETHEYHEISDDEAEKFDLGPSLLDEINSMFGSISVNSTLTTEKITETNGIGSSSSNHPTTTISHKRNDFSDLTAKLIRKNSAGCSKKSKNSSFGSVKPISVKDEKILNQAIEIANEISARSMCSLVSDMPPPPPANTQSPKRKFSFRFPHLGATHSATTATSSTTTSATLDKTQQGNHLTAGIGGGGSSSSTSSNHNHHHHHLNSLSPNSKKKNFTEELQNIPDLQKSSSSGLKNINSSLDIRIPLFDKESSDYCFKKSHEILSRPLIFTSTGGDDTNHSVSSSVSSPPPPPPQTPAPTDSNICKEIKKPKKKSLSENLLDIENTLKVLNFDFIHSYRDFDKTDSDETILNDQFSNIVSSIDEEISSCTGSLKSAQTSRSTTFDYTQNIISPLEKTFPSLKKYYQNDATITTGKYYRRSNTPTTTTDTGVFVSRDTIPLSRHNSQKSTSSFQDSCYNNQFNSKSINSNSSNNNNYNYSNNNNNSSSNYSPNKLQLDGFINSSVDASAAATAAAAAEKYHLRLRSMSFTECINPDIMERSTAAAATHCQSADDVPPAKRGLAYKSRSIRARTLRRLSYNNQAKIKTKENCSPSTSSDEESELCMERHNIALSDCDIRSRAVNSSRYRRQQRHKNYNRNFIATTSSSGGGFGGVGGSGGGGGYNHNFPAVMMVSPTKLYGSNVSIKSAPNYNYVDVNNGQQLSYQQRMAAYHPSQTAYIANDFMNDKGFDNDYNISHNSENQIGRSKIRGKISRSGSASGSGSGSGSASSSLTSTAAAAAAAAAAAVKYVGVMQQQQHAARTEFDEIIGQEGREAYNSLIERKHSSGSYQFGKYSMAKTLPRRSTHFKNDPQDFADVCMDDEDKDEEQLVTPPLQNAPRPTTLPTRGAGCRGSRKVQLDLLTADARNFRISSRDGQREGEGEGEHGSPNLADNESPCESPSYISQTRIHRFPGNDTIAAGVVDCNPLPVPSKEGKKHIQTNAKRHVRKYPLIIPNNNDLPNNTGEQQNASTSNTTQNSHQSPTNALPTIRPFNIHNNNYQIADYENTNQRNYENIKNTTDDSASLQFESILEADFNKDQVLHTPDVTDGFYNFSIHKEHYHKSKEVDYDPKKLTGLYVNEDELRNLDIDKNLSKLKQQQDEQQSNLQKEEENSKRIPSLHLQKQQNQHENNVVEKVIVSGGNNENLQQTQLDTKLQQTQEKRTHYKTMNSINPNNNSTNNANSNHNELAGHALFQKVRKSAEKAATLIASNSVSCEDLLDFANQKPKGRERGVDSDEVRIMLKVLGQDVTAERCLNSLEFINWDVHKAIKILKLQNGSAATTSLNMSIAECVKYLLQYEWDLQTAVREVKALHTT